MILSLIKDILDQFSLCTSCLGRQFGNLLSDSTNKERGESLLLSLGIKLHQSILTQNSKPDELISLFKVNFKPILSIKDKFPLLMNKTIEFAICYICEGLFSDEETSAIIDKLVQQANKFEFKTFLIGSTFSAAMIEREEEIRSRFGLQFGEPLKSAYNREIGKLFSIKLFNTEVDFNFPDILFIVNPQTKLIQVNANPIFIEGRYRKLVRGIPQAIWHCSNCRGKGCNKCNYSGRNYPDAVEEYIIQYFLRSAKGSETKFHCAGREDVDALMLGKGRPFVIEIRQPKLRKLNLAAIEHQINKNTNGRVDVTILSFTNRARVRRIKGQSRRMAKRYRMKVELAEIANVAFVKEKLTTQIEQQTPTRVLHRRANITRIRQVFDIKISQISPRILEIDVYCEGGLYVKELIHGDNGRTKPNLASLLNTSVKVHYLDVLEVESLI